MRWWNLKGLYQRMDVVIKLCKPPVPQAPSNTSQNSGYQGWVQNSKIKWPIWYSYVLEYGIVQHCHHGHQKIPGILSARMDYSVQHYRWNLGKVVKQAIQTNKLWPIKGNYRVLIQFLIKLSRFMIWKHGNYKCRQIYGIPKSRWNCLIRTKAPLLFHESGTIMNIQV